MYKATVDSKMCTDQCKCDESFKSLWQAAEPTLKDSGRFNKAGRDFNSFKWTNDVYVNSWKECYDAFIVNEFDQNSYERKFLEFGGGKFVEELETDYECAGLCYTPLFYMYRDISIGPPTIGCIEATAKGMAAKYGQVGLVSLITGVVLFIGMIGACPLCTGLEGDDDEKE